MQGSLKFETIPELFWDHHEGVINVFIQNIQVAKILAISLSEITTLLYLESYWKMFKSFHKVISGLIQG